jgi:hypothetical protein
VPTSVTFDGVEQLSDVSTAYQHLGQFQDHEWMWEAALQYGAR